MHATSGLAQPVQFLTMDWTTRISGFDLWQRQRISPLDSVSRSALGPTLPPIKWVPGVLSTGVKRGRGVLFRKKYISQWSHGVKCLFFTWILGSWVRIPLNAWMSVLVFHIALSSGGRGNSSDWFPVQEVLPNIEPIYNCKVILSWNRPLRYLTWLMKVSFCLAPSQASCGRQASRSCGHLYKSAHCIFVSLYSAENTELFMTDYNKTSSILK
jgi:hypothetical protein